MFKELNLYQEIYNQKKIIFCHKSSLRNSFIDYGQFGILGENSFILDENEENLKLIKKYLEFKIFELLNKSLKYNCNYVDRTIWNFIPNILNINKSKNINNEIDFYNLLNLTFEEINIIQSFK